ncbi:MAG: 2Fe-2S iron-sulfur cluster-binding protein [Gammaproteobacteria bacterium]
MSSQSKPQALSSRTHFFSLTIAERRQETPDACSFLLTVPAAEREKLAFLPGQHLIMRAVINGQEERRSYSLCGGAGEWRILIKRVAGGVFSNHVFTHWREGDVVEAMRPQGSFGLMPAPASKRNYLALAAGSGITPIIAILESLLLAEPQAQATLIYGNQSVGSIIFRERLADMKDIYLPRFSLFHLLSREKTDNELFYGRLNRAKCDIFFRTLTPPASFAHVFLCGPTAMMKDAEDALQAANFAPAQVSKELFVASRVPSTSLRPTAALGKKHCRAEIIMDGVRHTVDVAENQTVLEAALSAGLELPFSCRGGVCATCRAKLRRGKVVMQTNYALAEEEQQQGFVLACQSRPQSAELTMDFDSV